MSDQLSEGDGGSDRPVGGEQEELLSPFEAHLDSLASHDFLRGSEDGRQQSPFRSASFDPSELEEAQWYSNANVSERAGSIRSFSAAAADRSGPSHSCGPSFATVSGAALSAGSINVSAAVAAAHQSLPAPGIRFFWESGFWSQIFGGRDDAANLYGADFKRPEAPVLGEAELQPRKVPRQSGPSVGAVGGSSFLNAVRDREVLSWKQKRDKERDEALSLWESLLVTWPERITVIGQILVLEPQVRRGMVEDLLGGKAPATLRKRYRSVLGYALFLRNRRVDFPGSEELFYAYMCMLREEGKPSSTRKSLLEAITFCRFVLGIPELASLGESKRCHGSARARDFKPRVQASPFTVEELSKLHRILFEDPEPWNQLMAGSLLFCVYSRARWEDLEHADRLIIDRADDGMAAYIEASVGVHKTMGAKIMKGQLLPLVAPAVGVVDGNWIEQYVKGMPTIRSLDSDEAGDWARLLLFGSKEVRPERRVSSHSCKCTCISFATKFGASPEELLLLGYHTGDFKMPLTYGRDSAAPTLILLNRVLLAIRQGTFKPDCTRSGRFVKPCSGAVVEIKDEDSVLPEAEPCEEPVSSEAATTGSGSSSESSSAPVQGKPSFARWVIPDPPEGMSYFEHTRLKTLHLVQDGHTRSFACGRSIGPLHRKLTDRPGPVYTRCRMCAKIAEA
ncbi:unnamed protein product [Symbiodinium sp. CCMP2592]|nr:unnamed protein product [Symbiodinium sp. CCMP2592]